MLCLVTGCAGFIGFHVTQYLLDRGERVIGVDDLNAYYDVALKQARLAQLQGRARFEFHQIDVADPTAMTGLAGRHSDIDAIIHLAAQAGVRYSLTQPLAYVEANVKGQVVLLETARKLAKLTSLVYASLGNGLGDLLAQGHHPDLGILYRPSILLPIIGLAALVLLPVLYKRWRNGRSKQPA